jgi:hypothetical protein
MAKSRSDFGPCHPGEKTKVFPYRTGVHSGVEKNKKLKIKDKKCENCKDSVFEDRGGGRTRDFSDSVNRKKSS